MINNARNEIRNVLELAEQTGAKLPKRVVETTRHALTLDIPAPMPLNSIADGLLDKLGDPKGFDAALPKALDEISRADATVKLSRELATRAAVQAQRVMRKEAEPIVEAFTKALQPHIDALNKNAGTLPETFTPTDLDTLTTPQFAAWRECSPASAQLETFAGTVRWLFRVQPDDTIRHTVATRLPLVEPPEDLEFSNVFAVIDAIAGIRAIGGPLSAVNKDTATFWPARVMHSGASFRIAIPTEARARADRLRAACIQPKQEAKAHA